MLFDYKKIYTSEIIVENAKCSLDLEVIVAYCKKFGILSKQLLTMQKAKKYALGLRFSMFCCGLGQFIVICQGYFICTGVRWNNPENYGKSPHTIQQELQRNVSKPDRSTVKLGANHMEIHQASR